MRQKIEKLLLWLVPLTVVATGAEMALSNFALELMGGASEPLEWFGSRMSVGEQLEIAKWLKFLPMFIVQGAIGVWLYAEAKARNASRWIWLFSGIFLKYWALALFLLVQLFELKNDSEEAANNRLQATRGSGGAATAGA